MSKHTYKYLAGLAAVLMLAGFLFASGVDLGKTAPEFTLSDANGKVHKLADYRGKYVILEWVNYGCPFVQKHYDSGNMQKLQKTLTEKDVIWFSICSSAPGKQGHFAPETINKLKAEKGAGYTAYLIDEDGEVGRMYAAKTTPHMFVINPEGKVLYGGAIDNIRSTDVNDIQKATNYVAATMTSAMSGKKVELKMTEPYGCSVKY